MYLDAYYFYSDEVSDDDDLPTQLLPQGRIYLLRICYFTITVLGPHIYPVRSSNLDMVNSDRVIVDVAQLQQLVPKQCQHSGCSAPVAISTQFVGCCLLIKMRCSKSHTFTWSSSPRHTNADGFSILSNNLLLCASLLFSGNAYSKVTQMCSFLRLHCIDSSMYHRYQSAYLLPVVDKFWLDHQCELLAQHSGKQLVVCGDGRCDSPGSSAKYCSYTILDMESNLILHTETV